MIIHKKGKNKKELLNYLDSLKTKFGKEISENNITIEPVVDGYKLKGEKRILFVKFWVDGLIMAKDECYELSWQTNAPDHKVKEIMNKIEEFLEEYI